MTFFVITCMVIAYAIARKLFQVLWASGSGITASQAEDGHFAITARLGKMLALPRWFWRNSIPVFFIRFTSIVLMVLVLMPAPSVLACACSEVIIGAATTSSGSSVNNTKGNFVLYQNDFELSGSNSLRLTRIYNSNNQFFGPFGYGWSIQDVTNFMITTSGDIQIDIDDQDQVFSAANGYVNNDNTMKLTFTGPTEVKVEDTDGKKWYFDTVTKTMTKLVDRNGNETTFTWNVYERQVGVDQNNNPVYTEVYAPAQITYADGRVLWFWYSLDSVRDGDQYLQQCTVSSSDGFAVFYDYTNGLLTSVSNSETGLTLTYDYHMDVNSYRTLGWLTKLTYANSAEVNITYNGEYNTANPLRVTQISGPEGYVHTYSYESTPVADARPDVTTVLTDSLNNSTTFATTNNGRNVTVTDALGNYTQSNQDAEFRLFQTRNKRGFLTTYAYDTNNTDPLARNNLLSTTNPLTNTWSYQYDANYQVTRITDPNSNQVNVTYDSRRNLTSVKNGLGQLVSTNTYNSRGWLTSAKDGAANEFSVSYNNYGQATNIVDPAGKSWAYTYSYYTGAITSAKDPLGHEMKYGYYGIYDYRKLAAVTNALGHVTQYSYDEMDQLKQITDANGKVTQYGRNQLQYVTSVTNALGNAVQFHYDAEGKFTGLTDALNHQYTYSHDTVSRVKAWTFPDGSHESYSYNAGGNLTRMTNTAGQVRTWDYDATGRTTTKTWVAATNTTFNYGYDAGNRVTSVSKVLGSTTISAASYGYNAANQLTNVIQDGKSVGYQYDTAQRLSRVTYPSGVQARYEYDSRSALSALKDSSGNSVSGYTYDDAGRLTKRTLANGLETVYEYDAGNRVTKITLRETATPANVKQSFEYGYDNVGNRLWVKYADGSGDVYQYDDTYQVTGVKYGVSNPTAGYASATNSSRIVTYAYDAVGNRNSITDNGNSTTYTKNNLNQYTAVGGVNYTYSSRGDLAGDGTWTYGYDPEGHLTTASKSGVTVSYSYDATGRRIAKTVNGVTTKYVYSGLNLIEERNGSTDALIAVYTYQDGIDQPVSVTKSSGTYYFQQDALGNVTALTNSAGAIVEKYGYDIYGKPTVKDGSGNVLASSLTPFLFTGREYDWETGLYHYRARAYSPDLGRFLQRDPIAFESGDENMYRYCGNDPVNGVDPSGLDTLNLFRPGSSEFKSSVAHGSPSDKFSVGAHGDKYGNVYDSRGAKDVKLTPEKLAEMIKKDKNYDPNKPVELNICNAGKGGRNSFAKKLAVALGNKVSAPDTTISSGYNGFFDVNLWNNVPLGGSYHDFSSNPNAD